MPPGTPAARTTLPPGTPAALRGPHGGVLRAGDLAGFVPQGYRPPSTSAQSWVAEFPPEQRASEAARLKAAGFVAGIGEQLAPAQGGGTNREGISVVEHFRSVGPYYYLVGFNSGGASTPTRSQLITAAESLYRRVRG